MTILLLDLYFKINNLIYKSILRVLIKKAIKFNFISKNFLKKKRFFYFYFLIKRLYNLSPLKLSFDKMTGARNYR